MHLRSHIVRRACEVDREVALGCVTKVNELEALFALVGPTEVVQLDVAVHHAMPVAVVQRAAQLREGTMHLGFVNRRLALERGAHRVTE